jgi:hypothetical protein
MSRGLDHIVHAVQDLDAAAARYRELGFTVGPRNQHPWGTANHIVQLSGFFIELLTVSQPDRLNVEVGRDGLARHFGRPNQEAIAQHNGFSTLILESQNVAADAETFRRAGIASSGEVSFSRAGTRPDGATVTVGFSLAFARDRLSPHTVFAVMRQHNSELFWAPALQSHRNGAAEVQGVVMIADNPADHHIFLSAFSGERDLHSTSIGVAARTPRGEISIIEPVSFTDQFGVACEADGEGATLAGLCVAVTSIDAVEAVLRESNIASHRHLGRLVVGPQMAFGATIIFAEQQ